MKKWTKYTQEEMRALKNIVIDRKSFSELVTFCQAHGRSVSGVVRRLEKLRSIKPSVWDKKTIGYYRKHLEHNYNASLNEFDAARQQFHEKKNQLYGFILERLIKGDCRDLGYEIARIDRRWNGISIRVDDDTAGTMDMDQTNSDVKEHVLEMLRFSSLDPNLGENIVVHQGRNIVNVILESDDPELNGFIKAYADLLDEDVWGKYRKLRRHYRKTKEFSLIA